MKATAAALIFSMAAAANGMQAATRHTSILPANHDQIMSSIPTRPRKKSVSGKAGDKIARHAAEGRLGIRR